MEQQKQFAIVQVDDHGWRHLERPVVEEFPVRLTVNGRELATLIASSHQLNFLVAGFLRLQGFVTCRDDLLSLGICAEAGLAHVRVKAEIPEQLKPTLTSGCGTGISFNLPEHLEDNRPSHKAVFTAAQVRQLLQDLAARADNYKNHGGIHSAAVGDGSGLLLAAEDIGRHNTLDRIAGEALLKGIDLRGKMLVTSGRVSTEMVAKAARLGIALIASRTSTTDMAIRLSEEAGITLIGYARGSKMEVYSHPEGLLRHTSSGRIQGVTGVILAGGESRRMGCDKSLLPFHGARFIDLIYRQLDSLFEEVLLVTNSPDLYKEIPCRKVPDIYFKQGALAGIHSGLCHARSERVFVVACDMPFVSSDVARFLCSQDGADVVIPSSERGLEPLHAIYHKHALPAMEEVLDQGRRRIVAFFPQVQVKIVPHQEMDGLDGDGKTYLNINTPQEYFHLRGELPPGLTAESAGQGPDNLKKQLKVE